MYEGRKLILRFSTRKARYHSKSVRIVHFYNSSGGKVFLTKCEHEVIFRFFEIADKASGQFRRSKRDKIMYLERAQAENLFRKLVILTSCRQRMRTPSKIQEVIKIVISLGEFETIFGIIKSLKGLEEKASGEVCRVAKAFRILHGIN